MGKIFPLEIYAWQLSVQRHAHVHLCRCCRETVEGRDQANWTPWLTSCPASQVTTGPPHTTNLCWQLISSWIPPRPPNCSLWLPLLWGADSTMYLQELTVQARTLSLTLNHLVPAFDPPASSGWHLPSASPKPSSKGLNPTGLGAKRWKLERDFLAVLCWWLCRPCWFSLVPVCVHSAHTCAVTWPHVSLNQLGNTCPAPDGIVCKKHPQAPSWITWLLRFGDFRP